MSSKITAPSPKTLPSNLTSLSKNYLFKATLAIVGIVLFFLLYLFMIYSLVILVKYAFIYEIEDINKLTILMKLGAIAGSIMLLLFTLKFVLKLRNVQPDNRIKLNREEHNELFDFIHQICTETGAPKPKSIYVDPDVNAYVRYTNIWMSLILPTKKDLTIGLGLVSTLNLSEFKAVMAHEFGHFAQKSMKIGSYIHSANTIIHDMIFTRDKWDDILDQWRNSDIRLSAAAWVITPVIWLIRKALELFYMFLNLMHSSLSREMEFNADKVAVKSAGSVAIVSALWKLDYGFNYWNSILNNAYYASKKNIFTDNLYFHKSKFALKNKPLLDEKFNSLEVELNGSKKFFEKDEHSSVSMYASHPPSEQREANAKTPFVDCEFDERSPWELFSNKEKIQKEMTLFVYDKYFSQKPQNFVSEAEFEKFIESESRNLNLVDEYQNTFQNRFLNLPEIEILKSEQAFEGDFTQRLDSLKEELKVLMEPVLVLEEKMSIALNILNGETKLKSLNFNNVEYTKKNVTEAYNLIFAEREKLFNDTFREWDYKFVVSHYKLSLKHGFNDHYIKLIEQQKKIINVYRKLIEIKNQIVGDIQNIQSKSEVTPLMVNNLSEDIVNQTFRINDEINTIDESNFVSISNIDSVQELKESLVDGGQIKKESGNIFENGGIGKIMDSIEIGLINCNRVENKNLDEILILNKKLIEMEN
ncbi:MULTISPECIES: M48 family metallopeptidase [Flavobacterium]|nr:M48 family metallopeptidase [Flavobacterium sp. N1846]